MGTRPCRWQTTACNAMNIAQASGDDARLSSTTQHINAITVQSNNKWECCSILSVRMYMYPSENVNHDSVALFYHLSSALSANAGCINEGVNLDKCCFSFRRRRLTTCISNSFADAIFTAPQTTAFSEPFPLALEQSVGYFLRRWNDSTSRCGRQCESWRI